jgi:[acyl-carrier-protein] S-malonyltransferase
MGLAYVFPGQGSQKVGMASELAKANRAARDVLERVDEALKFKLSALMAEGPQETLTLTANAQPAIMASSMAVVAALKSNDFDVQRDAHCVAGHSLGEYTALCAAGSMELEETALLLRRRGEAMQGAVSPGHGAMAALLGASLEQAERACSKGAAIGIVSIANDNAEGQVVISGERAAVETALEAAKAEGVKRAMMLDVSAPFHCALMKPAQEVMEEALNGASILPPHMPVVNNVTANATSEPDELRRLLVEQVTKPVRWRESILWMRDNGVESFIELGTGTVLTTMMKRIDKTAEATNVETPRDIDAFLEKVAA